MAMRGPRQPIGSASWIAEERSSAMQIAQSEVEEFSFSARNDVDWLNEHMAEIFSENQINVADVFKTPGKLRGKTPRTARKANVGDVRVPLSSIFSATPKGAPNPFAISNIDRTQPQTPKLKVAEDRVLAGSPVRASPGKLAASPFITTSKSIMPPADSGYHGSQSQDIMEVDELVYDDDDDVEQIPTTVLEDKEEPAVHDESTRQLSPEHAADQASPTQPTRTFHSAREEQTVTAKVFSPMPIRKAVPISSPATRYPPSPIRKPVTTSPKRSSPLKPSSAVKTSPMKSSAVPLSARKDSTEMDIDATDDAQDDDDKSPSDGSSPIRGVLRKSSLNFASLPAREPLTSNKSLGARMSRTSHLDQPRQSYYSRHTHGKSLGVVRTDTSDDDEMDVDDELTAQNPVTQPLASTAFNSKTYTQRLQDRISMLGKSQSAESRVSKSIANLPISQHAPAQPAQQSQPMEVVEERKASMSPRKAQQSLAAPGAFPEDEDDEDDWIAPPAVQTASHESPARPTPLPKSYSTDVMEGLHGKETISESDFVLPLQQQPETLPSSPQRPQHTAHTMAGIFGHAKSASVPVLPQFTDDDAPEADMILKKTVSASNPPILGTVPESGMPGTPKSPSRMFRDSPLKQVKNKLSSILKSSKGLLASSAAISAEGKSSLLSPSGKLGSHTTQSVESLLPAAGQDAEALYPDLSNHAPAPGSPRRPASPVRLISRKTRASAEREKRDQKQKDKESKEAQKMADQMEKLEKLREKEREKARIFSKEQDRVVAMEKKLSAQKEAEAADQPPPPPPAKDAKSTRTSPRKTKAQAEAEGKSASGFPDKKTNNGDVEMADAQLPMPPPTVPRSAAPTPANRSIKRPTRPTTQSASKAKQAPTVIRVNTTSSQQSGFHPTNSVLSVTLQDTLGSQQQQLKSKASSASLHNKPSLQSLKSSASSTGRPKALELAAKRKEQEEREAQRKREAKAEIERKRAALQDEERRLDEQRRQEAQKQREKERELAESRKTKRPDIEKAKQTRAPPPAPRVQPNGPPDFGSSRTEAGPSRPPSRLQSTMHRPQEDSGRPVNAVLSNTTKAASKRPLTQDNEDGSRPCFVRSGPSFQAKETKRIRMTEEFDEDELEMGGQPSQSHIKGPPVRPSAGANKVYMPNKSMFPNGYGAAPQPQSATRDLFKATVTAQHGNQSKATHPLDMAQVSKSAIPFAPNPNAAGHGSSYKTPARPAGNPHAGKSTAKSAARSSPRVVNGDAIELPEIQTDDEDSDDDGHVGVAAWADSPDLRRALMRQETIDPLQIFGPPAPLNMEEVFKESRERFHKFRARTSSANWSGIDRLTEDDIRKDLAARDKMRKDGGWSYELGKDVM